MTTAPVLVAGKHKVPTSARRLTGVLVHAAFLQDIKQLTDAIIHIAHGTVVRTTSTLDLLGGEVVTFDLTDAHQTSAVRVLFFRLEADIGQVNVDALIQIPILVLDGIWVMRVGEGNCQCEGTLAGRLSGVVIQILLGLVQDLLVIV
jgi:hypothetical protein